MSVSAMIILAQQGEGGGLIPTLIMFGVIFLIFYFLLIRPQKKEMERHQGLINGLKAGDRVVTAGGLFGTIKSVDDTTVELELGRDNKITIARQKIQSKQEDLEDDNSDDKN